MKQFRVYYQQAIKIPVFYWHSVVVEAETSEKGEKIVLTDKDGEFEMELEFEGAKNDGEQCECDPL